MKANDKSVFRAMMKQILSPGFALPKFPAPSKKVVNRKGRFDSAVDKIAKASMVKA